MKIIIEDREAALEVVREGNNRFYIHAQDTDGASVELSVERLTIIHFIHGLKALLKEMDI